MKRRRREGSALATVVIVAATAVLLYAVVSWWPRAPLQPGEMLGDVATGREEPAAAAAGDGGRTEEITADEQRALEEILQRQPRTP